MSVRNSVARGLLLALAVSAALLASACSKKRPRLDEAGVKAFLESLAKADDAFDARVMCDAYAKDAKLTLTEYGKFAPTVMDKTQACDFMRKSYEDARRARVRSSTRVEIERVNITPDGLTAEVVGKLYETVTPPKGPAVIGTSEFQETVELIDEKPQLTSTIQTVTAMQAMDR